MVLGYIIEFRVEDLGFRVLFQGLGASGVEGVGTITPWLVG